jgi:hypothetical protein
MLFLKKKILLDLFLMIFLLYLKGPLREGKLLRFLLVSEMGASFKSSFS